MFDGFRFDEDGPAVDERRRRRALLRPGRHAAGQGPVPETVANVVFGGPKRNRLFICATSSLYAVMLAVRGA